MVIYYCLLLQTHDNLEHLAMMERILGTIPYRIVRRSKLALIFMIVLVVLGSFILQLIGESVTSFCFEVYVYPCFSGSCEAWLVMFSFDSKDAGLLQNCYL